MGALFEPSLVLGAIYLVSTAVGIYLLALAALSVLIVSTVMRWVAGSVVLLGIVWTLLPTREVALQTASLLVGN